MCGILKKAFFLVMFVGVFVSSEVCANKSNLALQRSEYLKIYQDIMSKETQIEILLQRLRADASAPAKIEALQGQIEALEKRLEEQDKRIEAAQKAFDAKIEKGLADQGVG